MSEFLNLSKFCFQNKSYIIHFLPTFLDNAAVHLFKKEASRGPLFVVWDITDKCNCRCSYCDHWKNPHSYRELDLDKKMKIIDNLALAKVGGISLCGGEPLLAEGLGTVIKRAKDRGLFVNLDTNGSMLEQTAEMLIEKRLDSIIISVETGGPEEHDNLRNHKNLFDKLNRGIGKLKDIRKGLKPSIFLRTLIHKQSYPKLDGFVQYWGDRVDNIIFQPVHDSPENFQKTPPEMVINKEEEPVFRKMYSSLLTKYPILNSVYNRMIPAYFFDFGSIKRNYICFQGTFLADIDSQANLYFCTERIFKLGNLLQNSILTLWNSADAKQLRNKVRQIDKCCWQANSTMNIYLTKLLGPGKSRRRKPQ